MRKTIIHDVNDKSTVAPLRLVYCLDFEFHGLFDAVLEVIGLNIASV